MRTGSSIRHSAYDRLGEGSPALERLSAADLDRALRFVGEIEAVEAPSSFPTRMLTALKQLIPCDMAGYNEVDRSEQRVVMVLDPDVPEKETFARVARQHPVLRYHARSADGRALKISDFLTRRQYHGLELYQDAFRLINAEDQISIALPAQPSIVLGIALNRDRPNFSERDRRLLDLVRPHLAQAYRNAELRGRLADMLLLLEGLLQESDRAIVLVDKFRRVTQATHEVGRLFSEYFAATVNLGSGLPTAIDDWIKQRGTSPRLEAALPSEERLVAHGSSGCLTIGFLPHGELGVHDALLLQETRDQAAVDRREPPLSPREHEVLVLVAEGKTNPEISTVLSISSRTVQKHLEHIFDKLGVRSRAAAAVALTRASGIRL